MRRRIFGLILAGLWLCPAFSLAAEAPSLSLRAEPGCLRLFQGGEVLREWPLDNPAAIELYWDEGYVYAQIALDEPDVSPVLLCFARGAAQDWNVEGIDSVQWLGAPTPELRTAWGLEDAGLSLDGPLLLEIPPEEADLLPCGLHARAGVLPSEEVAHSALQACGQAYECDASHVHMVYDCGVHFNCQGGDAAEHLRYAACDHHLCGGMPHPALDCGIHSACDADPLAHALQPCGHFRCDPACDGTLHTDAEAPADSGGN